MNNVKMCSNCGIEKQVSEFYTNNARKDKRMTRCIACIKAYDAQRANDFRRKVSLVKRDANKRHDGELTTHEVAFVISEEECCYCGKQTDKSERTIEHVSPHVGNKFSNVLMACKRCNQRKNQTPFIVHAIRELSDERLFFLVDRLAQREGVFFEQKYEELNEEAKRYFREKAEAQIKQAGEAHG